MSLWNDKEMTLNPYDKKPCTFEGYYDKLIGQIGMMEALSSRQVRH